LNVLKKDKNNIILEKKRHTIKVQLIICLITLQILSVRCRKGHEHDFRIFKESKLQIHPEIIKQVDKAYVGIDKIVTNCEIPYKESKLKKLTKEEKKQNKILAKSRIYIEHINRQCKIFRITKETYRGKHKNYSKTWNIIAGLVNLRNDVAA